MRFSIYKYPKLNFYGLISVFSFLMLFTVLVAAAFLSQQTEGLWIGVCFFGFVFLCFLFLFLWTLRLKADYFAAFSVDEDGITVYHAKNGMYQILWSEIEDSGILYIHRRAANQSNVHQKFVYFSKKKLAKKDIFRLNCRAGAELVCAQCRDEILWKVREYFPLCLDVKNIDVPASITKKDLE